ncbi:MAG TPA: DUF1294 domain-containing protein [Lacunisphaera sp.]|nr:DUF1294 domain-containing protein [Lacunisphaera sp.]
MAFKGRIVEWSRERGFGYVESEGRRVFLHWREFKEHHKRPEEGDVILFELGQDKQGRPCATKATHHNDGGRLHGWHWFVLALLLAVPVSAAWRRMSQQAFLGVAVWCVGASALTYFAYYIDKRSARAQAWRAKETQLHLMELVGGWPGAFLAQYRFRHKSSKASYQFVFFLIVGLYQFVAVDAVRGWPLAKMLFNWR